MTSEHCLTGTDRVSEVANKIKSSYINVQGDEPVLNPGLKTVIASVKDNPEKIYNGFVGN